MELSGKAAEATSVGQGMRRDIAPSLATGRLCVVVTRAEPVRDANPERHRHSVGSIPQIQNGDLRGGGGRDVVRSSQTWTF
jgi:hypothetical protein